MIISKNPENKKTHKTPPPPPPPPILPSLSCSRRQQQGRRLVTHRAGFVLVLLLLGSALATVVQSAQQQQQYALALPHAVLTITPDEENANPITVVLGHSNEPTFGVKPGVHDGKHAVEVFLEDAATLLPLSGSELTVDKFYFRNLERFEEASSLEQADAKEENVPLEEVFGEAGRYISRQIQQPGIYGYRLSGNINYFDVATVPIDTTVFCSFSGEQGEEDDATAEFNSEGWVGSYGCTENIKEIFFPPYTAKTKNK